MYHSEYSCLFFPIICTDSESLFAILGIPGLPQFISDGLSLGDDFSALQGGPVSSYSWLPHRLTHSERKKGNFTLIIRPITTVELMLRI